MSDTDYLRFTIEGSTVVAVEEFDDGRWEAEEIDSDESYSINGNTIIKTEYDDGRQEFTTYSDENGDGIYSEISKSYSNPSVTDYIEHDDSLEESESHVDDDHAPVGYSESHIDDDDSLEESESHVDDDHAPVGYSELHTDDDDSLEESESFPEVSPKDNYIYSEHSNYVGEGYGGGYFISLDESGNFIGLYEYDYSGQLENETEFDSEYVFADGILYETELENNGVEISIYSDLNNDGVYEKTSSEYQMNSDAKSQDFVLSGALGVYGSNDDDWILLSEYVESEGGSGSDSFVMRDLANATIKDFNASEGDKIVFDTGYGLSNVDDLAQYVSEISYESSTQTLLVDFNGLASLEIVGIADHEISWNILDVYS